MSRLNILFDMDGVLVETVTLTWQAYNAVLAQYGVKIEQADLHRFIGKTIPDQVVQLNHEFGLTIDAAEFDKATGPIKRRLMANLVPAPGAKELLDELSAQHARLAVGTSTARADAMARLQLAGLVGYFDIMVFEEDIRRHKPDPEVYLTCASRLGVAASECIVIEDAPSGVRAARRAGAKCVAVQTSYSAPEFGRDADLLVDSLSQLSAARLAAVMEAESVHEL